ncbi:SpoIIE family protein phosphatase [Yinghuangia aomiensis]|uniref:SpoIIE family protein phosphatase n=1 Tax=Yinghuangia aomiensis TaxID=676205 RepID=A0ABP9HE27_9ACTN
MTGPYPWDPNAGDTGSDPAWLRHMLRQAPIGIAIVDTELRCVWLNDTLERNGGIPREQRLGKRLSDVLPGLPARQLETYMRNVLDTGTPLIDHEYRGRTAADPEHEHAYSTSFFRLEDQTGAVLGVCYLVIDVTDRWNARHRLALLSDAGARIGTTLDVAATAQELADAAVPALADFAAVDLLDTILRGAEPAPGPLRGSVTLRRIGQRSTDGGLAESTSATGETAPIAPGSPAERSLVDGRAVLEPVLDPETVSWLAADPPAAARARDLGMHSLMVIPIRARGITLGVAHFFRRATPDPFEGDDLILAEEFVSRAAVAIDNARRFTREHAAALALQRSLLPHALPKQPAVDVTSHYMPADPRAGVGGDWFDVIPLSGARVALVIGDVAGHGAHAAATMGRLRASVHTLADLDMAPDELLAHLDDLVIRFVDEEDTGYDGVDTTALGASCLYAVYDPVSRQCSMARAGHPPPAVVLPDGDVTFPDLPAGPPLGLGGLPFESAEFDLPAGSLIVLYTDGLVADRDRDIESGLERLRVALADPGRPLDDITKSVLDTVPVHPPEDDVALLVARTRVLDTSRVVTWELPADPAVVAEARNHTNRQLTVWGLDDAAFTTELVISELVTNAIRYARGPIRIRLIRDDTLICEVSDTTSTAPRLRHARTTDEGGRGLFLVAQFTQRWGTRYTQDGKTIWAEQQLSSAPTGAPTGIPGPEGNPANLL